MPELAFFPLSAVALAVVAFWAPTVAVRLAFWSTLRRWQHADAAWLRRATFSLGVLWLALAALILRLRDPLTSLAVAFPPPVQAAGLALMAFGLGFLGWSVRSLSLRRLLAVPTVCRLPEPGGLVTSGPYRYVRHPLYSAELHLIFGAFLLTGNAAPLVLAALWWAASHLVIAAEERDLRERFGKDYEEYSKRTPKLFPVAKILQPARPKYSR